jgi:class 3 adenylate cyclase
MRVEAHLEPATNMVRNVVGRLEAGELTLSDTGQLLAYLEASRAAAPQIVGNAVVTADYKVIGTGEAMDLPGGLEDRSDDPAIVALIDAVRERSGPWFWTLWVETLKTAAITAEQRVMIDGVFAGAVAAVVSVRALSELLLDLDAAASLTPFILYGEDAVLAHPALAGGNRGTSAEKPFHALGELNDPVLAGLWSEAGEDMVDLLGDNGVEGRYFDNDGDPIVVLMQRLEGYGDRPLIVGAHFRLGAETEVLRRLEVAFFVAGGILLLTLFGLLLISRRVARPMQELAQAALAVESLELEKAPQLKPGSFRETAAAAEAFNSMLRGLTSFTTYVPHQLVRRLVKRGQTQSEERECSIMFTDIVGFTPLAGRLEPTALAGLLNRHFALISKEIEETEGTLDKYIGDCVMAFWGAPDTQTDHRLRAVTTALGICGVLKKDNERRGRKGLKPVRVRIGLTSGLVVVGDVGAPGRINYTIIGDTVNRAQRLEQLGKTYLKDDEECCVLASAELADALPKGLARVERLGPIRLPGQEHDTEVVRLYPA